MAGPGYCCIHVRRKLEKDLVASTSAVPVLWRFHSARSCHPSASCCVLERLDALTSRMRDLCCCAQNPTPWQLPLAQLPHLLTRTLSPTTTSGSMHGSVQSMQTSCESSSQTSPSCPCMHPPQLTAMLMHGCSACMHPTTHCTASTLIPERLLQPTCMHSIHHSSW